MAKKVCDCPRFVAQALQWCSDLALSSYGEEWGRAKDASLGTKLALDRLEECLGKKLPEARKELEWIESRNIGKKEPIGIRRRVEFLIGEVIENSCQAE